MRGDLVKATDATHDQDFFGVVVDETDSTVRIRPKDHAGYRELRCINPDLWIDNAGCYRLACVPVTEYAGIATQQTVQDARELLLATLKAVSDTLALPVKEA
jgi:hypothetical protein